MKHILFILIVLYLLLVKSTVYSQTGNLYKDTSYFKQTVKQDSICFERSKSQLLIKHLEERNYFKNIITQQDSIIFIKQKKLSLQNSIISNDSIVKIRYKSLYNNEVVQTNRLKKINLRLERTNKLKNTVITVLSTIATASVGYIILTK